MVTQNAESCAGNMLRHFEQRLNKSVGIMCRRAAGPLHTHNDIHSMAMDELTAAALVLAMAVDADGTEEVQVEVNLGASAPLETTTTSSEEPS